MASEIEVVGPRIGGQKREGMRQSGSSRGQRSQRERETYISNNGMHPRKPSVTAPAEQGPRQASQVMPGVRQETRIILHPCSV